MKKRVKEKMLRFCLKCASTNLKIVETPWKLGTGQFFASEMKCMDCGFEGPSKPVVCGPRKAVALLGLALEGNKSFLEQYKKNLGEQK